MGGPQTRAQVTAEQDIRELEVRLRTGQPQDRLAAAFSIFTIGLRHELHSSERSFAANTLFHALITEVDQETINRLEDHITRLGYKVDRFLEQEFPDSRNYRTVYRLTGPVETFRPEIPHPRSRTRKQPRKEQPKEQPATQPPTSQEPPVEYTPLPRRIDLNLRPNMVLSEPAKSSAQSPIFPPSPGQRAEEFISNLPHATSRSGRESQQRISRDSLIIAVRARMLGRDAGRSEPITPPRFEEHAASYQVNIPIRALGLVIPLPLWNPKMYFTYDNAVREAKQRETLRSVSPPSLPAVPSLSEISERHTADAVEKYLLIALLDTSHNIDERIAAAHTLGRLKVEEAMPLLVSILRNPSEHTATPDLVNAVRMALLHIGTKEAITELRSNPDDYAYAIANDYLVTASSEGPETLRVERNLIAYLGLDSQLKLETKLFIASALSLGGNREGTEFLVGQFRNFALSREERQTVAATVRRIAWNREVEALLVPLTAPNEVVFTRVSAAFALGASRSERGVEALERLLTDSDLEVRLTAADSLAAIHMNTEIDAPQLSQRAINSLERRARQGDVTAVVSLARIGAIGPDTPSMLRQAASHENVMIRTGVAQSLPECVFGGSMPPPVAVDILSSLLTDRNRQVVDEAVSSLQRIADSNIGGRELTSRIITILQTVSR